MPSTAQYRACSPTSGSTLEHFLTLCHRQPLLPAALCAAQIMAGGFNRQDSPDALEQLRKAKKMLDEKLITQEDYDMLKTRLLNL